MYQKYIKRLLDIILSLLAIIITFPIFLIIGILVLMFIGQPAIFRQKRPGKNEMLVKDLFNGYNKDGLLNIKVGD